MTAPVTIPPRFNGPPTSGNGGYSCGLLALQINCPSLVRLQHPPPLDTPLVLKRQGDGGVEMFDGTQLVGTAEPLQLELDVPPAPTLAQAEKASQMGKYGRKAVIDKYNWELESKKLVKIYNEI